MRFALASPKIYRLFARFIGGSNARAAFVRDYIRPQAKEKVLDIGCGPADILEYLPEVEYFGFDVSTKYIEAARQRFSGKGTFMCMKVQDSDIAESAYDIVLAIGVLHHLADIDARQLVVSAYKSLRPGGRLVTIDGCYVSPQAMLARCLLSMDRGRHVRTEGSYLDLVHGLFAHVTSSVRHDLLPIPYTHLIMECKK